MTMLKESPISYTYWIAIAKNQTQCLITSWIQSWIQSQDRRGYDNKTTPQFQWLKTIRVTHTGNPLQGWPAVVLCIRLTPGPGWCNSHYLGHCWWLWQREGKKVWQIVKWLLKLLEGKWETPLLLIYIWQRKSYGLS